MRLGLIARADASGLGIQTHAFYRWMQPERTLVIDVGHLHDQTVHCNKATDLSRYPDALVCKGWMPDRQLLKQFMSGLTHVWTCETPYNPEVMSLAQRFGVKVVIAPNYEFLDRRLHPALWAAPSMWHWDDIPEPKLHVPVPIETDRFTVRSLPDTAQHFLHVAGRPAHLDRNGTKDLLLALPFIESEVTVRVTCQEAGYVASLVPHLKTPRNVTFVVEPGSVTDHKDLYRDADVLVSPRRYGGLHLPGLEALGCGLPVVMPAISPNDSWLPGEWLIPASRQGSFMAKQRVEYFSVEPRDLAARIDEFASDPDFYAKQVDEALRLRDELSWELWAPRYREVLGNV